MSMQAIYSPAREAWEIRDGSALIAVAWTETQARLIAAAPDMLEACEAVLGVLNHGTPIRMDGTPNTHLKHIDRIRAAIRKAKGDD